MIQAHRENPHGIAGAYLDEMPDHYSCWSIV